MSRRPVRSKSPAKPPRRRAPLINWRALVRLGVLLGIWGLIVVIGVVAYYGSQLPRLIDEAAMERKPSITILAEDGSVIARYGEMTGAALDANSLPPNLVSAVLAVEDRRFYHHFGIDPIGLSRAIVVNLMAGRTVQGGSTITQQLAKNLFLTPKRNLERKIQEALLAIWLETKFTKNEILAAYLNRAYFGAGAYGVDAAAEVYYNKSASELSLRESATIAGLLRAPSRYSPARNPNEAEARTAVVLSTMVEAGFISSAQLESLKTTPSPRRKPGNDDYARYFADWITDQVSDFVGENHGDIVVQTTLRPVIQKAAERNLKATLDEAGEAKRISQGAVVVMTLDGAVRAMVGGKDWSESQFNRAVQAQRQPGSSFKPVIYLTAITAAGYTPETEVEDAPISVGNYSPDNFTAEHEGWVPLKDALAKSLNTVAVRLLQEVGLPAAQANARKLGLPTPADAGLSYALGTSEVSLLQLTAAYGTFATAGQAVKPYAIHMIRGKDGRLLWRRQSSGLGRVIEPEATAALVEMMKGVSIYGTGTGANLGDREMAGKTGTSQDFRDAWFMGFTADFVAGVWLGNDDNTSMKKVTGGGYPARTWKAIMQAAEAGLPARPLATSAYVPAGGWPGGPVDSGNPLADAGLIPMDGSSETTGGGFFQLLNGLTDSAPAEEGR